MLKQAIKQIKEKMNPEPEEDWFDQPDDGMYDPLETDNSRWELEYEDVLVRYEHILKNEYKNSKGQWVSRPGTKPQMNHAGVSMTLGKLAPLLNKGIALSSTNDAYVRNFVMAYTNAYKKIIITNTKEFQIEHSNVDSLIYNFMAQVYAVLTRSINDGERKIRMRRFPMQEHYRHDEVGQDELRSYRL